MSWTWDEIDWIWLSLEGAKNGTRCSSFSHQNQSHGRFRSKLCLELKSRRKSSKEQKCILYHIVPSRVLGNSRHSRAKRERFARFVSESLGWSFPCWTSSCLVCTRRRGTLALMMSSDTDDEFLCLKEWLQDLRWTFRLLDELPLSGGNGTRTSMDLWFLDELPMPGGTKVWPEISEIMTFLEISWAEQIPTSATLKRRFYFSKCEQ